MPKILDQKEPFNIDEFLEKLNSSIRNLESLEEGALNGVSRDDLERIIEKLKDLYRNQQVDENYLMYSSSRISSSLLETTELSELELEFRNVLTKLLYGIID